MSNNAIVSRRAARCLLAAAVAAVCLGAMPAQAAKLKLPAGMGGVPDIGAIPCAVFSEMIVVGPLGTRHSLLTWAGGYFLASHGKTLQEMVDAAGTSGEKWDWRRLTTGLVDYCAAHPEELTREAVKDLGRQLGVAETAQAPAQ